MTQSDALFIKDNSLTQTEVFGHGSFIKIEHAF